MRLSWTQKSVPCRTIYTATWLSLLRKMASATMEVPFPSWRPIMSVYNRIFLSQLARTSTGSTSHFFPLSLHFRHLFVSLFLLGPWVGERIITCELSLFVQFQLPENWNPKLPNFWTNSQTLFFFFYSVLPELCLNFTTTSQILNEIVLCCHARSLKMKELWFLRGIT